MTAVAPEELSKLVAEKSCSQVEHYGGIPGLLDMLRSNADHGLMFSDQDSSERVLFFGENKLPTPPSKLLFRFIWDAMHDKTLIMLMIASFISLIIGFYRMLFVPDATSHEWLEGAAILAAVFSVVIISSLNDWVKDRKFRSLHQKNTDRQIHVLRNSKEKMVSVFTLLVGDIVLLEAGEVIPADGILVDGHSLVIDESSLTGESKPIRKGNDDDYFLLSGTTVCEGIGKMLILAVGRHSLHGQIMTSMMDDGSGQQGAPSITPLQKQLFNLAEKIAYFGIASALLLFGSLLIKLLISERNLLTNPSDLILAITNIFIQAVTILVVAVPEGLPMAVTLTLAFASTKMTAENNLVRVLSACETMGSATCICTDKTGTLTTNQMSVVGGSLFGVAFGVISEDKGSLEEDFYGQFEEDISEDASTSNCHSGYEDDDLLRPLLPLFEENAREKELFVDSIILNSTAIIPSLGDQNKDSVIGSKTEVALLQMLQKLGIEDPCMQRVNSIQSGKVIADMVPFSSERKMMKVSIDQSKAGRPPLILIKGAPELILASCSMQLSINSTTHATVEKVPIDDAAIKATQWRLSRMGLRTIAFAYYSPDDGVGKSAGGMDYFTGDDSSEMSRVYIGMVGIEDPLREDVPKAVLSCQRAGISIRMVTGDSLETASSIAKRAGILMRGGLAIEGPRFRSLDEATLNKIVPRLQVLSRSSPLDKQILVNKLKALGDIVTVTGDGTNDGPALRSAHVGFSMGITGTEVAKQASSIILMDDKFSSIVKAISWGRCVGDSVRKFLLFQLTVNISAVVVAFISALLNSDGRGAFNALQLLWVNLLMDTLGALALATDGPTPELLDRKPEGLNRQLVTKGMWIRILGMALFQIVVLLLMISFLSDTHKTFVFNTFVMMQLWNEILCRTLPPLPGSAASIAHKFFFNPFKNMLDNHISLSVLFFSILGQFLIVEYGGTVFGTVPLSKLEWAASILIGATCLPLFFILNYISSISAKEEEENASRRQFRSTMASRERLQWHAAVTDIQNGLSVFSALRRARPVVSD